MQQQLQDRITVNISWCSSTDEMMNEKYYTYWYIYMLNQMVKESNLTLHKSVNCAHRKKQTYTSCSYWLLELMWYQCLAHQANRVSKHHKTRKIHKSMWQCCFAISNISEQYQIIRSSDSKIVLVNSSP